MAKKSKKGGFVGIIVLIILALIAIGLISSMPWLLIIIVLIVILAALGNKKSSKPKQKAESVNAERAKLLSDIVNNDIRIVDDCVNILNNSSNLKTVISRYNVLLEALQRLSSYEGNPAVSFPRGLPSEELAKISGQKAEIMNRAIQRAYDDTLHKCAALKTEKGRKNRQMKFFDELNELMPSLPPDTQEFAIRFINENINDPLTGLEGL